MNTLTTRQILDILPHRYPFLMIDKVIDYDDSDPGGYLVGVKNFTVNEPYVQGHFPHHHIMPGVMLMEAMAQASTILVYKQVEVKKDIKKIMDESGEKSGILFVSAENVRFKRIVRPGDQLIIHAKTIRNKRNLSEFEAYITVDDEVVASVSKLKAVYKFDSQIKPWDDDQFSK